MCSAPIALEARSRVIRAFVIAPLLLLLTACPVFAQTKNELPLYGDEPKTDAEKEADAMFIREAIKIAGSKEKASEQLVQRGWVSIEGGNYGEAIRRFNQAYLLDSSSAEPYWGLAVIVARQERFDLSETLFQKAMELAPQNARLRADYGYMLVTQGLQLLPKHDEGSLNPEIPRLMDSARKEYLHAIRIGPDEAVSYGRLAVLEYYAHNYQEAWRRVRDCQARGGEGLDPRFLRDLQNVAPQPQRPGSPTPLASPPPSSAAPTSVGPTSPGPTPAEPTSTVSPR